MSEVSNVYQKVFANTAKVAYDQYRSILHPILGSMAKETNGSACEHYLTSRGTEAHDKNPKDFIPVDDTTFTPILSYNKKFYKGEYVDNVDDLFTSFSIHTPVLKNMIGGVARGIDAEYIRALNKDVDPKTGIAQVFDYKAEIVDGGNGLTLDKMLDASSELEENFTNDEMPYIYICGSKQYRDWKKIQEFTSSDYVGSMFPLIANTRYKYMWDNIIFCRVKDSLLPKTGDVRKTFLISPDALGVSVAGGLQTNMAVVEERDSIFMSCRDIMGAAVVDGEGIVTIDCQE